MSFYMVDNLGELVTAPSVYAPTFTLTEATKGDHEYPVDGWHWFATDDAAITALLPTVSNITLADVAAALRDPLADLTASSTSTTVRTAILNQRAALDALLGQLETP